MGDLLLLVILVFRSLLLFDVVTCTGGGAVPDAASAGCTYPAMALASACIRNNLCFLSSCAAFEFELDSMMVTSNYHK